MYRIVVVTTTVVGEGETGRTLPASTTTVSVTATRMMAVNVKKVLRVMIFLHCPVCRG